MKKIKIITSILTCLALLMCLLACSSGNASTSVPDHTVQISELLALVSGSYVPEDGNAVGYAASRVRGYKDVDEMFETADDVIIAKVLDKYDLFITKLDDGNEFVQTVRYIEILHSFKDFYKVGDIVPIGQTGSTMEDGRDDAAGGVPLLKDGQSVLLFVDGDLDFTEYSDAEWAKSYACVLNSYQGKFYIDSDGTISPSRKDIGDEGAVPGSENLKNFESVFALADKHKA